MREHGRARYIHGPGPGSDRSQGCRCDTCRTAIRDYERERTKRTAPPYVSAVAAREHVRFLSEHGVGLKRIVEVAGVSHGGLWKLMYGKDGQRSKRIRRETQDRILAVQPSDAAAGAKVDAARTWANVRELLERGWTKTAIAHAIGQVGSGLQLGRQYVTAGNARAVEALLDQPVPPRRSRWGTHEVEQPDDEATPVPVELPRPHRVDLTTEAWRGQAACRMPDVPVWMFFPGRGDTETTAAAMAVCGRCAVREACLDTHISEKFGVWGGTTERERRRLRRERGIPEDDQDESEAA
jgi:WhiB family redox-sensing transcriptional regulator